MSQPTARQISPDTTDHPEWPGRVVALFQFSPGLEGESKDWEYGLVVCDPEYKYLSIWPSDDRGNRVHDIDAEGDEVWTPLVQTYAFGKPTIGDSPATAISGHYRLLP